MSQSPIRQPKSRSSDGGDTLGGKRRQNQRRPAWWSYARIAAIVLLVLAYLLIDGTLLPGAFDDSLLCPTTKSVSLGASLIPKAGGASRDFIPRPLPVYRSEGEPAASSPDRYTLMINTFKRPNQLLRSLRTYEGCSKVAEIRVIWSEPNPAPATANLSFYSTHVPVRYDVMPTTSFNNRFRPVPGLKTEAVFAIDDDVYMPCEDLDRAFHAWQRSPRQLAGFYPRATVARTRQEGGCLYEYATKLATVWLHRSYSIVLTKAAVFHRDYLEMYTHYMPAEIREEVDRRRNCEDIAMQFLVSHVTNEAPTAVGSLWITDIGQGNAALGQVAGVSAAGGHLSARGQCVTSFAQQYGHSPLVSRALGATEGAWRIRLSSLIFWR